MCIVQLYLWRENDQVVRRCRWVVPRPSLTVSHFALSAQSLAVVSTDGQAFTANIPALHCSQSSTHSFQLSGESDSMP